MNHSGCCVGEELVLVVMYCMERVTVGVRIPRAYVFLSDLLDVLLGI